MGGTRTRLAAAAEAIRDVLRNPDIRRLQTGWTLSTAADSALLVTVLIAAYDAGGAAAVGLVGLVRMLPATAVTLFMPIPRTLSRERLLVVINLIRGVGALVTAVCLQMDGPIAIVFAATALVGASGVLARPSQTELLPALARSPDELIASNVASSTGEGLGTLVGPLSGGLLVAIVGPGLTCGAAAIAFVLAAGVMTRIRVHRARTRPSSEEETARGLPIAEGLRTLFERPSAGAVIANFAAQSLVRGLLTTLIVVVAIEVVALGEPGVAWLNAAIGLGGLIGAVAALGLAGSSRLGPAFALALTGWGVPIALMGALPVWWFALLALTVVGISNAVEDITGFTLLQRTLPNHLRSAVFLIVEGGAGLAIAAGSALGPVLVHTFGTLEALAITGAIMPIAAVMTWPLISRLDGQDVVPERELVLLRGVPMFALLPLTTIERLASGMVPVTVAVGDTVMREGDRGDRYFIVGAGALDVTQAGQHLRTMGPGDGVGEIALLRAVPRTATVTATTDGLLYSLDCRSFLDAVTGHPYSEAEANRIATERLAPDQPGGSAPEA